MVCTGELMISETDRQLGWFHRYCRRENVLDEMEIITWIISGFHRKKGSIITNYSL